MIKYRLTVLCTILMLGCITACTRSQTAAGGDEKTREAEIRGWLDRWAKAFSAHNVDAIMSGYAPDVVAYDIVPPLQYVGKEAYRKDYEQFLAQYEGPLEIEYRDMHIVSGENVALAYSLERISGTMKNG